MPRIITTNVSRVFLAECHIHTEQLTEAKAILGEVVPEKLTKPNYCDYVFTRAALSIATGEMEELDYVEKLLQTIEFKEPYLIERRQSLLISVLKCKANGSSENIIRRALASLRGLFNTANKYLIIKPNFMGMGIDINKVFEVSEKEHRKRLE